MCGGGGKPAPAQAPAPAPPPPVDAPASPAFNEQTTQSAEAAAGTDAARRGRRSLRVDIQTPKTGSPGLNIPT